MAAISVLISSGGRKRLLYSCLKSVLTQNQKAEQISIAVPQSKLSDIDRSLQRHFFKLAPHVQKWNLIGLSDGNVSEGRNWAIKNSPDGILLLLDEDVSLPDGDYLRRLDSFHHALSSIELLGGPYTSPSDCSFAGRAYNQVARIWMEKHRNTEMIGKYNDLLVGGNISLKLNRKTRAVHFPATHAFGGEEKLFLNSHWRLGHSSRWIESLSVHHHAQHDVKTFYARAWLHGSREQKNLKLSKSDIQNILKYSERGPTGLMACSYLLCTRASSIFNRSRKQLQRIIPSR